MAWVTLKEMSAIIGLGIVGMLTGGVLLNYLANPIWIGIVIGAIIILGITTLGFYFMFLWEFIEQKIKVLELEKELEELKKNV